MGKPGARRRSFAFVGLLALGVGLGLAGCGDGKAFDAARDERDRIAQAAGVSADNIGEPQRVNCPRGGGQHQVMATLTGTTERAAWDKAALKQLLEREGYAANAVIEQLPSDSESVVAERSGGGSVELIVRGSEMTVTVFGPCS